MSATFTNQKFVTAMVAAGIIMLIITLISFSMGR